MPQPRRPIKAVLFDFDDTLMATKSSRVPALIQAFKELGYVVTPAMINGHWGLPFNLLVSSIAPGIDYELFCTRYSSVMLNFLPRPTPYAVALLRLLSSSRIPALVISSGSRGLVTQDLEISGLLPNITKLWGYEDTPFHKPDPRTVEPVLAYLSQQNIDRFHVLYIGDSLADYLVAHQNDIPFCAVLTGSYSRPAFLQAGLPHELVLDSIEVLIRPGSWFLDCMNNPLENESPSCGDKEKQTQR